MKNSLHKTLCGLLITLCFQAGASTLHPLQLAGAITFLDPSHTVVSNQAFLLQPIHNSSVKVVATAHTINLSKDKKAKPTIYKECESGELETLTAAGRVVTIQQLSVPVTHKANEWLAGNSYSGIIELEFRPSTRKNSMRDNDSKDDMHISHYKDRTILYAKVVC